MRDDAATYPSAAAPDRAPPPRRGLIPLRTAARSLAPLRRRLVGFEAQQVHDLVDGLALAGVPSWVAGGWGIDALLGRRTRRHGDLDLLVEARHEDDALDTLDHHGFVVTQRRAPAAPALPAVTVLRRNHHAVDVIWFVRDDGDHTATATGEHLPRFGVDSFTRGVLEGRLVPCLSPAEQWRLHRFDLERRHRNDLRRLRAVYGDAELTGTTGNATGTVAAPADRTVGADG